MNTLAAGERAEPLDDGSGATEHAVVFSSADGLRYHAGAAVLSAVDRRCWRQFVYIVAACTLAVVVLVACEWSNTAAESVDTLDHAVVEYSFHYFVYCFIGGIVSGLPHVLLTPIDLIKCRMQVGEYRSLREGVQRLLYVDGHGSLRRALPLLYRGWIPTTIAYCLQGSLKFCLYEVFKYVLLVRPQQAYLATRVPGGADDDDGGFSGVYQFCMFLCASSMAELLADLGLAPWEAVKIIVQTSNAYPPFVSHVVPRLWATDGLRSFYKGLVPLWLRQVPYTMVKFSSFEKIAQLLRYLVVGSASGATLSGGGQLLLSLCAGVLAGMLCAVISHPADTLVSQLNQREGRDEAHRNPHVSDDDADVDGADAAVAVDGADELLAKKTGAAAAARGKAAGPGSSIVVLAREIGWRGLWRGLGARLIMVGTLTALQWVLYDSFKVLVGLPTTGATRKS